MDLPRTAKGVLIAIGIFAALVLVVYAASMLTVIIGVVLVAVVLYLLYILGIRVNRFLRDTPVFRRGER